MASVFRRPGSKIWTMQYIDRDGKWRQPSSHTEDRGTALRLAEELEAKEAAIRKGESQPADYPIEALVKEFGESLQTKGGKPQHVDTRRKQVLEMVAFADIREPAGMTRKSIQEAESKLRKRGKLVGGKRQTLKESTVRAYLKSCKSFTRWLAKTGKLAADPLKSVAVASAKTDERTRRYLTVDEWARLKSTTLENNADRFGMSAAERVLLYATSLYTGFWLGELRSLTRASLNLDTRTIICDAKSAHNGRQAAQRIRTDAAEAFRGHIAAGRLKAADALFKLPGDPNVPEMFQADAKDAGLDEVDSHGERLVFHSLQYTAGVWLIQNQVYPTTVQHFMRYGSYPAFEAAYGHLFPISDKETVDRLPALMLPHSPYKGK